MQRKAPFYEDNKLKLLSDEYKIHNFISGEL